MAGWRGRVTRGRPATISSDGMSSHNSPDKCGSMPFPGTWTLDHFRFEVSNLLSAGKGVGRWIKLGRFLGGEGRIRATKGWISVDRGSKATLPLTMPRRVFKSSAKDSAHRPGGIKLRGSRPQLIRCGGLADVTGPSGHTPLLWVGRGGRHWRRLLAWILT